MNMYTYLLDYCIINLYLPTKIVLIVLICCFVVILIMIK